MSESWLIRFLYGTKPGRLILKPLVHPVVSECVSRFLSSRLSKPLIGYYVKKHQICLRDVFVPQKGFRSFNAFFTRKRKQLFSQMPDDRLICPCDGYLTRYLITRNATFRIKHTRYRLDELLGDSNLARKFENGLIYIFRLTPADYHRYCYAASGRLNSTKGIDGVLHCIRPVAQASVPVFVRNSREYQVVTTKDYGMMVQMEIGALLVGRINNHHIRKNQYVTVGREKGFFSFGGSTIVLLFQEEVSLLLRPEVSRKCFTKEVRVRMGDPLLV